MALVSEHFFDEAASGTGPSTCADNTGNGNTLTIDYGTLGVFTSIASGRGFNFADTVNTSGSNILELSDISTNGNIGSSLGSACQTMAAHVVLDCRVGHANGMRVLALGSNSGNTVFSITAEASQYEIRWHNEGSGSSSFRANYTTPAPGDGLAVFSVYIDTTQVTGANRMKLYVDGVLASKIGTIDPTINDSVDFDLTSYLYTVGNRGSQNRNPEMSCYYAAIEDDTSSEGDVLAIATSLLADNDASPFATGITGTGSTTLEDLGSAGSGLIGEDVTGTGATTLEDLNSVGVGAIGDPLTGSGSTTLEELGSVGTGLIGESVTGSGITTFEDLNSVGVGEIGGALVGSGNTTLEVIASVGVGLIGESVTGSGATTLEDLSSLGSGSVGNVIAGSGNTSLENLVSVGSGLIGESVTGSGNTDLGEAAGVGAGLLGESVSGSGNTVLEDIESTGSGQIGVDISGIGSTTLEGLLSSGTGAITGGLVGSGDTGLESLLSTGSGTLGESVSGSGATVLENLLSTGIGTIGDVFNNDVNLYGTIATADVNLEGTISLNDINLTGELN